jgi:hypothetical protein
MKTYDKHIIIGNINTSSLNNNENDSYDDDKKWAKFTFFREDIRILTKIFRNSNTEVAYSTNNATKNKCRNNTQNDKYIRNGVYKLKCLTCKQTYDGQKF